MSYKEFSSLIEDNPHTYNYAINELIISFVAINSQLPTQLRDEFFIKFEKIWQCRARRETLITLVRLGAATQQIIMNETGLPSPSVSRAIRYLNNEGLITSAQKIRCILTKGGRKPTLWAIYGCEAERIRDAIQTHSKINSPIWTEADRITQLILDDYILMRPEWLRDRIEEKLIIDTVRENTTNYQVADMVRLVGNNLQNKHNIYVIRKVGQF